MKHQLLLKLYPFHLHFILNQLIDVSYDCATLDIHQHEGGNDATESQNTKQQIKPPLTPPLFLLKSRDA
jgi:hypothetical protein